jgi:hypothetical protein
MSYTEEKSKKKIGRTSTHAQTYEVNLPSQHSHLAVLLLRFLLSKFWSERRDTISDWVQKKDREIMFIV